MRLVFAGTPSIAVPALETLARSEHEIVGVLTREDAPQGRKRVLTPSPVAVAAAALGREIYKTNRPGADASQWLQACQADLGVIVAYGGLLREPVLSTPRHGWINLHFSALPNWRGAAPVQHALIAGEQRLGISVFRLVEELDAGSILARDALDVPAGTTSGHALELLATRGTRSLLRAIELIERGGPEAMGESQHGAATFARKLTRDDGLLDLSVSAQRVLAQWAGVTPEPGAFVTCEGQVVKVLELAEIDRAEHGTRSAPNRATLVRKRAVLGLSDGELELVRVQPAGRGAMTGADWLRGRGGEAMLVGREGEA